MKNKLNKLIQETTITGIVNKKTDKLICGKNNDVSRFQRDQGKQIELEELEKYWQKKFNSFGDNWNKQRQIYRFLYDQFRLFHRSFTQLRINKVGYLQSRDNQKDYHLHEFSTANLASMYLFGKKMINLTQELKLIDSLDKNEKNFIDKFVKTRNLLFEHNFNPKEYSDFLFDPNFWSIASSDSFLKVDIHTTTESEYYALIDYYQDYFDLESIMTKIIRNF